jgi:hypothetical protein
MRGEGKFPPVAIKASINRHVRERARQTEEIWGGDGRFKFEFVTVNPSPQKSTSISGFSSKSDKQNGKPNHVIPTEKTLIKRTFAAGSLILIVLIIRQMTTRWRYYSLLAL